ncbi:hypothetical protein QBC47DRAFT_156736 [Echria macrotheca]|uniref:Signal peptide-containing protein n=1 Tax=Echria macrotheca TaxID=438768 RepID=A0AAJ0BFT5_9PEZI|nr:hypothetical protein QBC47DRAFT_156736 [Echria macrotheca]
MSFCVAVQSAIFYFVACTPCNKVLHRRKAKIKAKKEKEEKARVILEQPHLYQHPDPFHTNPFWAEEIRMGPSLQPKKKGGNSKSASQRGLANPSQDLSHTGTESTIAISPATTSANAVPKPTIPPSPAAAGIGSSPTIVQEEDTSATLSKTASVSTGDGWNYKRYQREDEELWGLEFSKTGQKLMDAIKQAGTTAGRFVESKLGIEKQVTEEDRYNFYFSPRNPPVNDYHPPVVSSKPTHPDALRWMLQPPPPAKVMEGKVPVSRTGSMMSVGSRRAGVSDGIPMGRLVGERALEAKIRNGETPHEEGGELYSATSSVRRVRPRRTTTSTTRTASRRTTGSYSLSTESEDSEEDVARIKAWRQSRRAMATPDIGSEDSSADEGMGKSFESVGNAAHTSHAAQKPRLPTIPSSETAVKDTAVKEPQTGVTGPLGPLREVTNTYPSSTDAN